MEAVIAELVLSLFVKPSLPAFLTACMGTSLWTIVQPFFTGLVFFGRSMFVVWLDLLDSGARVFRLPAQAVVVIVIALVVVHLLAGAIGGWLAWNLGRALRARQAGAAPANS
jgi:hypothetical protein